MRGMSERVCKDISELNPGTKVRYCDGWLGVIRERDGVDAYMVVEGEPFDSVPVLITPRAVRAGEVVIMDDARAAEARPGAPEMLALLREAESEVIPCAWLDRAMALLKRLDGE